MVNLRLINNLNSSPTRVNIHTTKGKAVLKMTKFTVIFKSGKEMVFTSEQFKNRLDVYNYICAERLGKIYGSVKEIRCSAYC